MDLQKEQIVLLITKEAITQFKLRDVERNEWTDASLASLFEVFADNNTFNNLSESSFQDLMLEMNNRVSHYMQIPPAQIRFEKIALEDWVQGGKQIGGASFLNGIIHIKQLSQKDKKQLSEQLQDNLGLEYLTTIIHETRHVYQKHQSAKYFNNQNVSKKNAVIAQDNFIELFHFIAEEPFDTDYENNIHEKDACGFTYRFMGDISVLCERKYLDKIEKFINLECTDRLVKSLSTQDAVNSQMKRHNINLKIFESMCDTSRGKWYTQQFKNIDQTKVTEVLLNEQEEYQKRLKMFIMNKINDYEKTNNSYLKTLQTYYNQGNYYKCYYGIAYIENMKNKQDKLENNLEKNNNEKSLGGRENENAK